MAKPVRVFLLNAGDCGACAAEVWAAVEGSADLTWAPTPQSADVVALTGSVPHASRNAALHMYTAYIHNRLPVVAVGRCAVDGHPFGKGGIAALPELVAGRKVDGSPPLVDAVTDALIAAAHPAKQAGA